MQKSFHGEFKGNFALGNYKNYGKLKGIKEVLILRVDCIVENKSGFEMADGSLGTK